VNISNRKKQILKSIVESYIQTAEPVGSRMISEGLGLSSATIRNEMAELTSMGLLEQPHTSAGRVPTPQGYRIYVNELMKRHKLTLSETEEINSVLRERIEQFDKAVSDAGRIISDLTSYPAYALAASHTAITIRRFDFIQVDPRTLIVVLMLSDNTVKNKLMNLTRPLDEGFVLKIGAVFNANFTNCPESEMDVTLISSVERATGDIYGLVASVASFAIKTLRETGDKKTFLTGTSHILEHPEYRDWEKAHKLMNYLSDDENVLRLPVPDNSADVKILIGPENVAEELKDSSVVVAKYDLGGGTEGLLGVVGPTRMDYAKVAASLAYIAKGMKAIAEGQETNFPVLGDESHKD
jgi:heat shock gene repressor HrcA